MGIRLLSGSKSDSLSSVEANSKVTAITLSDIHHLLLIIKGLVGAIVIVVGLLLGAQVAISFNWVEFTILSSRFIDKCFDDRATPRVYAKKLNKINSFDLSVEWISSITTCFFTTLAFDRVPPTVDASSVSRDSRLAYHPSKGTVLTVVDENMTTFRFETFRFHHINNFHFQTNYQQAYFQQRSNESSFPSYS